jgi:hypothetical protein
MNDLLKIQILKTSPKGYVLTEEGNWASELSAEIWEKAEALGSKSIKTPDVLNLPVHTVGGRGYINLLATQKFSSQAELNKLVRLRFLDLPPNEVIQLAIIGLIDSIIHFEPFDLPSSWMTKSLIERVPWKLHLRKNHPLINMQKHKVLTFEDILQFPFVVSTSWNGREIAKHEDGFPVPWSQRKNGLEAQTALAALQISANTDHLTFLPELFSGLLPEDSTATLNIDDLVLVEKSLSISVHTQRVSLKVFNQMVQSFKLSQYENNKGEKNENQVNNTTSTVGLAASRDQLRPGQRH